MIGKQAKNLEKGETRLHLCDSNPAGNEANIKSESGSSPAGSRGSHYELIERTGFPPHRFRYAVLIEI